MSPRVWKCPLCSKSSSLVEETCACGYRRGGGIVSRATESDIISSTAKRDVDLKPHSCPQCRAPLRVPSSRPGFKLHIPFEQTVHEGREAADKGCVIFQELIGNYDAQSIWQILYAHLLNKCECCDRLSQRVQHVLRILSHSPFQLILDPFSLNNMFGTTLQSFAYLDAGGRAKGQRYNAYTYVGNAASCIIPSLDLEVDSPKTLDDLKQWLSTCSCLSTDTQSEAFRPTRLVDLTARDGKYIIRRTDLFSVPAYACLSYCWGGPQSLQCMTDRLDPLGNWSCSDEDLPAVFIDAFRLARQLGFQYLWVDSLCILQDDELDKDREILEMPQIYKHAELTICASSAASCREGFLQTRPDYSEQQIPVEFTGGQQGHIYLDTYKWVYPPEKEPLGTRAWAFQERLLSPRVVEYGWRTARWSCWCRTDYSGNQHLQLRNSSMFSESKPYNYDLYLYLNPQSLRDLPLSKADLFKSWSHIVRQYSTLDLTFECDRLAAIGGVAQELERTTGIRYLAGLWDYERLPSLLQWRVTSPPHKLLPRPSERHAPSWSWGSINNQVMMHHSEEVVDDFAISAANAEGGLSRKAKGAIEISGPIKHGTWSHWVDVVKIGTVDLMTEDLEESQNDLVIWPDCIDEICFIEDNKARTKPRKVWLAAIGRVAWNRKRTRGLILDFDETRKTYTRLGLFEASDVAEFAVQSWEIVDYTIT